MNWSSEFTSADHFNPTQKYLLVINQTCTRSTEVHNVLKEQIGFYFILVKFFIYFCTGAILLFLGKKIFLMGRFLFKSFNKKFFFENIKFFINVILFIIISILVGWITIMLITKRIF
mgnify:CR=1 FL=1